MQATSGAVERRPVRFGVPGRDMVGMYHTPRPHPVQGTTALLCNPFGQEAVRAHRIFVVLADRLARQGVSVLRFDYHGTGDSPGDDDVGDLEGWAADILSAQAWLDEAARPSRRVWIGLRLGALLAAMASGGARPGATIDSLILWEPVIDGSAYLRELAEADRKARLGAYSLDPRAYERIASEPVPAEPDEALGFLLTDSLRGQLRAARGEAFGQARCAQLSYIVPREQDPAGIERLHPAGSSAGVPVVHQVDTNIDWPTNDAGGTTIAPAEVVRLVIPSVLGSGR